MAISHASSLMAVRKTTKSRKQLQSENYRRQKKTLYAKLEKMHVQSGANMCLFLERNGKFEIFTSHEHMLSMLGLNEAKGKIFPPPPIVTARDVATHRGKNVAENIAPKPALPCTPTSDDLQINDLEGKQTF